MELGVWSRRRWLQAASFGTVGLATASGDAAAELAAIRPVAPETADERAARRAALAQALQASSRGEPFWETVKSQYMIDPAQIYMNTGTYGPSLRDAHIAMHEANDLMDSDFDRYVQMYGSGEASTLRLVEAIARYIGADIDEIALCKSATEGMSAVAAGLDFKPGDEILTTHHEHGAGHYPWLLAAKRFGAVLRVETLSGSAFSAADILERFERAITPRTKLISFCHVQFSNGQRLPVKELCALARSRGVLSVVDGAQGIGMLDFDVRDLACDFYVSSLHKWLTAPYGTGVIVIAKDVQDRFWPWVTATNTGWTDEDVYGNKVNFGLGRDRWPKAMGKYSYIHGYYGPQFSGLVTTIETLEKIGRASIDRRIHALAERMGDSLLAAVPGAAIVTPRRRGEGGGLVCFTLPLKNGMTTAKFAEEVRARTHVHIRNVTKKPIGFDVMRASTHIFNTFADVDRAVEAVAETLARA
jgi:selenocysteine lyase/cysteine desulfurase